MYLSEEKRAETRKCFKKEMALDKSLSLVFMEKAGNPDVR